MHFTTCHYLSWKSSQQYVVVVVLKGDTLFLESFWVEVAWRQLQKKKKKRYHPMKNDSLKLGADNRYKIGTKEQNEMDHLIG